MKEINGWVERGHDDEALVREVVRGEPHVAIYTKQLPQRNIREPRVRVQPIREGMEREGWECPGCGMISFEDVPPRHGTGASDGQGHEEECGPFVRVRITRLDDGGGSEVKKLWTPESEIVRDNGKDTKLRRRGVDYVAVYFKADVEAKLREIKAQAESIQSGEYRGGLDRDSVLEIIRLCDEVLA